MRSKGVSQCSRKASWPSFASTTGTPGHSFPMVRFISFKIGMLSSTTMIRCAMTRDVLGAVSKDFDESCVGNGMGSDNDNDVDDDND